MPAGLMLGTGGTALYFGALFLWSAFIAYLVVFGLIARGAKKDAHAGHSAPAAPASHGHAPPASAEPAKPFRGYSSYEGFKSFATGDSLTIEDIVKGLARESGAEAIHEERSAEDAEHPGTAHHDPEKAASAAQATEFLRLLVAGEREAAFETLREIEESGEGAEPFLRRVFVAVESALNSRLHGATCDLNVLDVLGACDTPVIEELVKALGTAEGKNGGKLALARAFSALKK